MIIKWFTFNSLTKQWKMYHELHSPVNLVATQWAFMTLYLQSEKKRLSIFLALFTFAGASREKEINFLKKEFSTITRFVQFFLVHFAKKFISLIDLDEKLLNKVKNVELKRKKRVAIVLKMRKSRRHLK